MSPIIGPLGWMDRRAAWILRKQTPDAFPFAVFLYLEPSGNGDSLKTQRLEIRPK
jgi:hypothetical protein